jgi:hypothetical protein
LWGAGSDNRCATLGDHVRIAADGAERNPTLRRVASAPTSTAASAETVEQSATMLGAGRAWSMPSGPDVTARRSSEDVTIVNTMSQSPRSLIVRAWLAPSAFSGAVFDAVRFQVVTSLGGPSQGCHPVQIAPHSWMC